MTEVTTPRLPMSRRVRIGAAAFGLLVVGGVAGTVASHALQPAIEMAPLRPVSIASLPKADGIVTIRGKVAEVYGNKFVIDDGSARTLVDTGRAGDRETPAVMGAAIGAPVTVQGRFDRGFVHASFLVDAAGKVTALAPMHGPGDGPRGGPDHRGPDRDGPDRDGPGHDGPDSGPQDHRGPPPPRLDDAASASETATPTAAAPAATR